jgi:hypothetical protein
MKMRVLSILPLIVFLSALLLAQESPTVTVEDIQICTFVEDRQPVGSDTSFTNDVGQLYCFTKLSSDQDSSSISHVWYYNDEEKANVALKMKAKTWRTWSSKKIPHSWSGEWRVDVLSSTGEVLSSKKFVVKELPDEQSVPEGE